MDAAQIAAETFIKDKISELQHSKGIIENVSQKIDIRKKLIQSYRDQLKIGKHESSALLPRYNWFWMEICFYLAKFHCVHYIFCTIYHYIYHSALYLLCSGKNNKQNVFWRKNSTCKTLQALAFVVSPVVRVAFAWANNLIAIILLFFLFQKQFYRTDNMNTWTKERNTEIQRQGENKRFRSGDLYIFLFVFLIFSISLEYTSSYRSATESQRIARHNSFYLLCYGRRQRQQHLWWWWRRPNKMLMSVGHFSQFNVWNVYFLFAFGLLAFSCISFCLPLRPVAIDVRTFFRIAIVSVHQCRSAFACHQFISDETFIHL